MSDIPDQIIALASAISLLVIAAMGFLAKRRADRAMAEPVFDNACVACGSTELFVPAPRTYECLSCGHCGGSGQKDLLAERDRARVEQLSPEERVQQFEQHLLAARRILSAVANERPTSHDSEGFEAWGLAVQGRMGQGAVELQKAAMLAEAGATLSNGFEINPGAIRVSLLGAGDDPGAVQKVAGEAASYIDNALPPSGP